MVVVKDDDESLVYRPQCQYQVVIKEFHDVEKDDTSLQCVISVNPVAERFEDRVFVQLQCVSVRAKKALQQEGIDVGCNSQCQEKTTVEILESKGFQCILDMNRVNAVESHVIILFDK